MRGFILSVAALLAQVPARAVAIEPQVMNTQNADLKANINRVHIVPCEGGPGVACLSSIGSGIDWGSCGGCYAEGARDSCLYPGYACVQHGPLARINVYPGTRFTAITHNGVYLEDALVRSIEEWRKHPLTVYWCDSNGKHIEQYSLTDFKYFAFK